MFAIKKTNQRAEDVLPHTGPRSIRLPEPMSPLWRVLSWLNTVSALREEAGLKEGGCKEEEEGGGRGWQRKERRAECQDVAQQAFSLSNRQNYHSGKKKKKHTIQDHALTEKSVTPPPAHIPTQTCKYECTYHKHKSDTTARYRCDFKMTPPIYDRTTTQSLLKSVIFSLWLSYILFITF